MKRVSRRKFLAGLVGVGTAGVLAACGSQPSAPPTAAPPKPTSAPAPAPPQPTSAPAAAKPAGPTAKEVKGFLTLADVDKAEKEGSLIYYASDTESQVVAVLQEFSKLFPKIDTSKYFREQAGRLYTKLTSERQANTFTADVLAISNVSMAMDFMKKNGYAQYNSPHLDKYDAQFRSNPAGNFTWYSFGVVGIAYNTKLVPEAEAPKTWKDLLNPRWQGTINFKDSASGWQATQWYVLRKLYGEQYWKEMAAQKLRAVPGTLQQYERLINGEEKIVGLAQYNNFLELKAKGAPIEFVIPSDGVSVGPLVAGVVDRAPHPEAARLFFDWFLSSLGQQALVKVFSYHSPRKDVAPPLGGKPISEMKVLVPDWEEFATLQEQFTKEWNGLVGLK